MTPKPRSILLCLFLIAALLLGLAPPPQPTTAQDSNAIETRLAGMTLEEKVGQMFMVTLFGKRLTEQGDALIREYHPGAVALFGFNTDFETGGHVALLINEMQTAATESGAGIPLFIAADQEGGEVRRIINDVTEFPDPLAMGAVTDLEVVRNLGEAKALEMRALGVNMNLSPVADLTVQSDMENFTSVMYRRTMGDDPQRVGAVAAAYAEGLARGGVVAVAKHFPGHGGTVDSHRTLPIVETPADEALAQPLRSFEVAVGQGIPAVMVGHLHYSQLEDVPDLPASLSPTLLGILRDDFGFEGLAMTDALDMAAVAGQYPLTEATLMAVQAGVDMVVFGPNVSWQTQRNSMAGLAAAVRAGDISEARIDASVRRILAAKVQHGVDMWEAVDTETVVESIDLDIAQTALDELYLHAATALQDNENLLPIVPDETVAVIYPAVFEGITETCREVAPSAEFYGFLRFPSEFDYNAVNRLGRLFDTIVIMTEDITVNIGQGRLIELLPPEKTVVVALGTPYDLARFADYSTLIAMYSSLPNSHAAACRAVFGQHPISGRTPMVIGDFPSGTGLNIVAD